MKRANPFKLVCQIAAMFRLTPAVRVLAWQMGVRQMVDAGQQRSEHLAIGHDAADRNSAEIHAMISALAPDQAEGEHRRP